MTSIIDVSVIKSFPEWSVSNILEGLGLFVLVWCQPVLPVLNGVRTYVNEPGGIALVQRNSNISFFWVCAFIKRLSDASMFFLIFVVYALHVC